MFPNHHRSYFTGKSIVHSPLPQPPALRIFLLGTRGSGKTTHGKWLAEKLGIFYIQFRERLQELILAKTQTRVPYSDEVEPPEEPPEELAGLLEQAEGRAPPSEDEEDTDTSDRRGIPHEEPAGEACDDTFHIFSTECASEEYIDWLM